MAVFEVTAPDGKIYEVPAPDDSTPEELLAYVQKNMMGVGTGRSPPKPNLGQSGVTESGQHYNFEGSTSRPGMAEAAARRAMQGLTFGYGDEVVAGAAATLDPLVQGSGGTWSDRYQAYKGREAGRREAGSQDYPITSVVSEIAGAIPTAVLAPEMLPARVAQGTTVLGRVGRGALTGGTQGSIYGFGTGEGGFANRAESALYGGALGAGAGALAPAFGGGARSAKEYLQTGRQARDMGMSRPAYDQLSRVMRADDSLTGQGLQRMDAAGPNAMLADAGPSAQGMLDTIVQRSGPGGRQATNAIEGRATQAGEQVNRSLDTAFGPAQGRSTIDSGIRSANADEVTALYNEAYRANPVISSRNIDRILETPDGKAALKRAAETMQNDRARMGMPDAEIADQVAYLVARGEMAQPKGGVAAGLNLRSLDLVKRELWDIAQSKMRTTPHGVEDTTASRASKGLWRDLMRGLDDADVTARTGPNSTRPDGGAYQRARGLAQDTAENRQALEIGTRALSPATTRDALRVSMADMSPAERNFVAQGIRSQIDDTLANVKRTITDPNIDAREAIKAVKDLSSRASREKVRLAIGDNASDRFYSEFDQAARALELRASVAQNSKTFPRLAMDEQMKAATDDGVVNAFRSGEPVNVMKRLAQTIMGRTAADKARIEEGVHSELVQALVGQNGRQIINQLTSAQGVPQLRGAEAQRLAEALIRSNTSLTGPVREAFR